MRYTRPTKEIAEGIIREYAEGSSIRQLADDFKTTAVRVRAILVRNGVATRELPAKKPMQASSSGVARPEIAFAKEYGVDSPAEAVQKGLVDIMDWVAYLEERKGTNAGSYNSQGFSLELGQGN